VLVPVLKSLMIVKYTVIKIIVMKKNHEYFSTARTNFTSLKFLNLVASTSKIDQTESAPTQKMKLSFLALNIGF